VAVGASLMAAMSTRTVPRATLLLPSWSLAVTVRVAAPVPKALAAPVYVTALAPSRKALMAAVVPVSVRAPEPLPPMVTPLPLVALRVPASAARVSMKSASGESASDRVRPDRSITLATSSVAVATTGRPLAVGALLGGLTSMATVPRVTAPLPSWSLAVTVRVPRPVPVVPAAVVRLMASARSKKALMSATVPVNPKVVPPEPDTVTPWPVVAANVP